MKTAVITGTSSGLGEGFATALLSLGWKVYGLSRRDSPTLSSHKNFRHVSADFKKPLDKQLLSATIGEKELDLLVNNAGMVIMQRTTEWNERDSQEMFAVHYSRPVELLNYFHEKLRGGMVISTLSDSSHIGWPNFALYGASKAALWLHMKTYAAENPQVSVVNLHPSAIDTPIIDHVDEEMQEEREEFMNVKDMTTLFLQLVTGTLSLPSGSDLIIHNEWQKEEIAEWGKDEYLYNIDTEQLTRR